MTQQDPKRFDLIAALEGRTYPEDSVYIFLDEAQMYAYAKARRDADLDPSNEAKEAVADEIYKAFEDLAIEVSIRGVPRYKIVEIADQIEEEFPTKTNAFGQPVPNRTAEDQFNLRTWALYITKMALSDGSFSVPGPEEIEAFRRTAPSASLDAVGTAINEMSKLTQSGYEQIVQDPDFLSRHSRTA